MGSGKYGTIREQFKEEPGTMGDYGTCPFVLIAQSSREPEDDGEDRYEGQNGVVVEVRDDL